MGTGGEGTDFIMSSTTSGFSASTACASAVSPATSCVSILAPPRSSISAQSSPPSALQEHAHMSAVTPRSCAGRYIRDVASFGGAPAARSRPKQLTLPPTAATMSGVVPLMRCVRGGRAERCRPSCCSEPLHTDGHTLGNDPIAEQRFAHLAAAAWTRVAVSCDRNSELGQIRSPCHRYVTTVSSVLP